MKRITLPPKQRKRGCPKGAEKTVIVFVSGEKG